MSLINLQKKLGLQQTGVLDRVTLMSFRDKYQLSNESTAHFFGQTSHETGGFKLFVENLNYSANGLKKIFGKYFPGNLADLYARQPEKIANRVYASRMGNGDEKSGDGWKYRGRGALQLTGKDNYIAFSEFLKNDNVITNPDLVANEFAFESALFFFNRNKLWNIAASGVTDDIIIRITKRVNGGTHGLQDRITKTKEYYNLLTK
jgi:putative chitinase